MATRFYLHSAGTPTLTPLLDSGWEQTGQVARFRALTLAQISAKTTLTNVGSPTIPITTTQDILCYQYISSPMEANQVLSGTISLVLMTWENATTNNATLALVAKVVSNDGLTLRGTLFSVFGTDTEFPVFASRATRIVNAQTITGLTTKGGDRLVFELGARATAPSAAGSFSLQVGLDAASDYALTSGLTTNLNPWIELSQNIRMQNEGVPNNYQFVGSNDRAISVTEKIR